MGDELWSKMGKREYSFSSSDFENPKLKFPFPLSVCVQGHKVRSGCLHFFGLFSQCYSLVRPNIQEGDLSSSMHE